MNNKDSKVSRPGIEYIQTADLVNRVNMDWFYIVMFWLYLLFGYNTNVCSKKECT